MTIVRVLGCSDAFGSGGRLFPAFLIQSETFTFLLDCGPTAVLALKRAGVDPDILDAVLISHFHGDHYGGMPFLEIELAIMRQRRRPLAVGGPPEVAQRVTALADAMYPALPSKQRVEYEFTEWSDAGPVNIGPLRIRAVPVIHTPESRPYALRVEVGDQVIAYSGDTEWTDELIGVADGADLFICEATSFSRPVPNHLSYDTIKRNRARLNCKRLLLTHMGDDMLTQLPVEDADTAEDGLTLRL